MTRKSERRLTKRIVCSLIEIRRAQNDRASGVLYIFIGLTLVLFGSLMLSYSLAAVGIPAEQIVNISSTTKPDWVLFKFIKENSQIGIAAVVFGLLLSIWGYMEHCRLDKQYRKVMKKYR
jgi:hypothetical protein